MPDPMSSERLHTDERRSDPVMTYLAATREAMIEEMERDSRVFLMGEDIAKQGGVFGQFEGLADRFGVERIRDTPISEAAIIGSAVGAALTGSRPVVEMQFADFLACAMDELVNQAAKMRYMFGGQGSVPLVVRAPQGAIRSAAAQHSQSLEAWFCHVPGWRVVAPSNPADAKGLLKTAIRSDDPVLYFEHKALYTTKGRVPAGEWLVPLGSSEVIRTGSDLTIVSWSLSVRHAMEAAEQLDHEGISAEVVDLRTLAPLDMDTVVNSATHTGRVLIVHESVRFCGLGAEIAAQLGERPFGVLKAPVLRLANPGVPVPFAPSLERAALPQVEDIVNATRELVSI